MQAGCSLQDVKNLVSANKPLAGVMYLVLNTTGHKRMRESRDPKRTDKGSQTLKTFKEELDT